MENKLIAFIQNLFRWIEKIKWNLIFNILVLIILAGSVSFGIYTRQSYDRRSQNPTSYAGATVQAHVRQDTSSFPFDPKEAFRTLEECSHVMLVKHISNEQMHMDTKSTVEVLQVFRGNGVQTGDNITVFENLSFSSNEEGYFFKYYQYENRMLPGTTYLVFLNEKELDTVYKDSLEQPQFVSGLKTIIQGFKVAPKQTESLSPDSTLTYGDIQNDEFICFDQTALNALNQLREMAFQTYGVALQ